MASLFSGMAGGGNGRNGGGDPRASGSNSILLEPISTHPYGGNGASQQQQPLPPLSSSSSHGGRMLLQKPSALQGSAAQFSEINDSIDLQVRNNNPLRYFYPAIMHCCRERLTRSFITSERAGCHLPLSLALSLWDRNEKVAEEIFCQSSFSIRCQSIFSFVALQSGYRVPAFKSLSFCTNSDYIC